MDGTDAQTQAGGKASEATEVRLVQVVPQSTPAAALRVLLPSGARMLVHDDRAAEVAAHLLRHLQHSSCASAPC